MGGVVLPISPGAPSLAGSVIILALGLVIGVVAIWDVGGLATTMRNRLEGLPLLGGSYGRLPSWMFRAFGVWCVAFAVGQLVYVYVVVHRTSH